MKRGFITVFPLFSILVGCAPTVRFVSASPEAVRDGGSLKSLDFPAVVETNNLNDAQLIYQVRLLDQDAQPVRAPDGPYRTQDGEIAAARTIMVLQSPWLFDNLRLSIPAPIFTRDDIPPPVYAELGMYLPTGECLARKVVDLPLKSRRVAAALPPDEPADEAAEPPARSSSGRRPADANQKKAAADGGRKRAPQPADEPEVAGDTTDDSPDPDSQPPPPARATRDTPTKPARDAGAAKNAARPSDKRQPTSPNSGSKGEKPVAAAPGQAPPTNPPTRAAPTTQPARKPAPPPEDPAPPLTPLEPIDEDPKRTATVSDRGGQNTSGNPARDQPARNAPPREPAPAGQPTASRPSGNAAAGRAAESDGKFKYYVVRKGDTLRNIAAKVLKDGNRWNEIYEANRDQLSSPDGVRENMILRVPNRPAEKPADNQPKRKD